MESPVTREPGVWWRLSSTEQRVIIQFWRPSLLQNYPSQFTDFTITDAEPLHVLHSFDAKADDTHGLPAHS